MKVPTYRQQTGITEKTGATMFGVRADPGAMSAGLRAVGDLVSSAEKMAVDYYAEQQKIKRQTELDDAEFEYKQELQKLQQEQTTRKPKEVLFDDPPARTQSFSSLGQQKLDNIANNIQDKRVRRAFKQKARNSLNTFTIDVNQSARNRLIDQNKAAGLSKGNQLIDDMVMGNPAQRAAATLELFGDPSTNTPGHYEKMAQDGYIKSSEAVKYTRDAQVSVRDRAKQADTAIMENNVNKRVVVAGDVKANIADRQNAYTSLIKEIDDRVNNGTIDPAEGQKKKMAAADDTARSTIMGIMTSSADATAAVMQIASGDIQDPILGQIFKEMDQGDVTKIVNDMFTIGTKIDTERREKEEADEEKADEANRKNFETIINVDQSDEEAMASALALHKDLLKDNFYTATERKAAEAVLGLGKKTQAGADIKTTKEATKILNRADNDNILTPALVDQYADQLSTSDYNAYYKRAITEGKEGRTAAKSLIGSKLRYNEFKDSNNALGDASDAMFQQSMFELDDWLNTSGEGGGAGASYQQIVEKARDIIKKNDAEYKTQMQEALITYVTGISTLPDLIVDPADPVGSTLQYLANQDPRNPVVKAITLNIKNYQKLIQGN